MLHENDPQPELFDLVLWAIGEFASERPRGGLRRLPATASTADGVPSRAWRLRELRKGAWQRPRAVLAPRGWRGLRAVSSAGRAADIGRCQAHPDLQTIAKLPRVMAASRNGFPKLMRTQTDPVNRLLAEYMRFILGHDLRVAQYVV